MTVYHVPPELGDWIEAHRGIVQPYALNQLVWIVRDLTARAEIPPLDNIPEQTVHEERAVLARMRDSLLTREPVN